MSTRFSIGQMNQLADTLEAAGYSPEDITRLRSSVHQLIAFKDVLSGAAQIVRVKHVIDLDANPFVPNGWRVERHVVGGRFEWDPAKVMLYLSSEQQGGGKLQGYELHKELKDKPVCNANLLDYLLAHPELIPESWKSKAVFFWGTIYAHPDGNFYVRYLAWRGGGWRWLYYWLGSDWHGSHLAAVLASS